MLTTFDNGNVFPNASEVTRQERYNTPPQLPPDEYTTACATC